MIGGLAVAADALATAIGQNPFGLRAAAGSASVFVTVSCNRADRRLGLGLPWWGPVRNRPHLSWARICRGRGRTVRGGPDT